MNFDRKDWPLISSLIGLNLVIICIVLFLIFNAIPYWDDYIFAYWAKQYSHFDIFLQEKWASGGINSRIGNLFFLVFIIYKIFPVGVVSWLLPLFNYLIATSIIFAALFCVLIPASVSKTKRFYFALTFTILTASSLLLLAKNSFYHIFIWSSSVSSVSLPTFLFIGALLLILLNKTNLFVRIILTLLGYLILMFALLSNEYIVVLTIVLSIVTLLLYRKQLPRINLIHWLFILTCALLAIAWYYFSPGTQSRLKWEEVQPTSFFSTIIYLPIYFTYIVCTQFIGWSMIIIAAMGYVFHKWFVPIPKKFVVLVGIITLLSTLLICFFNIKTGMYEVLVDRAWFPLQVLFGIFVFCLVMFYSRSKATDQYFRSTVLILLNVCIGLCIFLPAQVFFMSTSPSIIEMSRVAANKKWLQDWQEKQKTTGNQVCVEEYPVSYVVTLKDFIKVEPDITRNAGLIMCKK